MKVYHTLNFGTYNSAAFFLDQRLPITDVKCYKGAYQFYVGDDMVAFYNETDGTLQEYVNLNSNNRCYGKLW